MKIRHIIILSWIILVIAPLALAWNQLDSIAERSIYETIADFNNKFQTKDSISFTFIVAFLSTIFTLIIGLPLAWNLGRYNWPYHNILRSIFTVPFVMPSILVAMGFLALLDWISFLTDYNHSTEVRFYFLLLAHAWFNLALVIRFCEPLLSTIDSSYEEACRLLPSGKTQISRFRNFWLPLMWPNIAASSALVFVFSFTSFALVKFITPTQRNLEVVMANQSEWAGLSVPSLSRTPSEIVMASSTIQLVTIIFALIISSWLQSRSSGHHLSTLNDARKSVSFKSLRGLYIILMLIFIISPMLSLISSSFMIRENNMMTFSLDGWESAFGGSRSPTNAYQSLKTSIGYALMTIFLSLPIGFLLADTIFNLEKTNPKSATILDVLVMLPLALSAVMVGLGVLLGLMRTDPEIARSWWIPLYGHLMLTTPFVVRVLLPAMRNLNPRLEEAASLLGANYLKRLIFIRISLLTPSIIVASSLVFAISLGEFGASWVVLRFTEYTTLPVMIGDLLSRPGYDPILRPAANAAGTILLLITLVLFISVERFRPVGSGGEF
ncbi:iron ABC transporter permease [Euryarchaeota archaeon]|jgi:thiamine transport system permease protein|nr:iron ABC transporter permease [Candidatus Thalassarchaeum sp.]MDC0851480.1 iron ABC transporter permease [Euryarchaeota archaeon]MDC1029100.1 iron ABC transporter permease [Euryarchaeota archaeon]|tara:strand:+ start:405 stop:2063 length:1659 start_codon:yes stop_codon:yes gene_type:complete